MWLPWHCALFPPTLCADTATRCQSNTGRAASPPTVIQTFLLLLLLFLSAIKSVVFSLCACAWSVCALSSLPLLIISRCDNVREKSKETTRWWRRWRGGGKKRHEGEKKTNGILQSETSMPLAWQEHNVQVALRDWCSGRKKKSQKTDL